MCDCITRINELLAPRNGRLILTFTLTDGLSDFPTIEIEKIAPRGKKPPRVMPTFCPFCGEKYATESEGGVE